MHLAAPENSGRDSCLQTAVPDSGNSSCQHDLKNILEMINFYEHCNKHSVPTQIQKIDGSLPYTVSCIVNIVLCFYCIVFKNLSLLL